MKHIWLPFLVMVGACHSVPDTTPGSDQISPDVVRVDTVAHTGLLRSGRAVKAFYKTRRLAPFWSSAGRLQPFGDSLLVVLRQTHFSGLEPEDYHIRILDDFLRDTTQQDRAERIDVLLTDAFLTLYNDLKLGRLDPDSLRRRDYSDVIDNEAIAVIDRVGEISLHETLTRLEPMHPQYQMLKRALRDAWLTTDNDSVQYNNILKLSLNMERWRWEKQWPGRYVVVNIPAFLLQVIEDDSVWLESRVVVGKRETPTPVMESVIRSFLIYPYWHVPRSIATKEILPVLQADPAYLSRNNFQVLNRRGDVILADTIQWTLYRADYFPFTLRQREGSENSMGIIKFNFANRYGVYLHDTNSKRLYKGTKRDLSHGCVRVERAIPLAHYLVREDDIYVSPEDLDQYLSLQQRLKIDLRKPIPLKLVYFTAEVRNGQTMFYDDIYKKDSLMIRGLYPPVTVPAETPAL